jgi:uncharacterized repeat protein (TIGR01451 family)
MMTTTYSPFRSSRTSLATKASCFALCATIGIVLAQPAFAAGTLAGTDILNTAEATYDTPSGPVTIQSNTVTIKVDELLDVTVASTDPGDITTAPGTTGNIQTYQVTNTGNGSEAFTLTANVANGGDDFNPVLTQIVLDSNGNGVYDPGVDAVYVAGSNDPVIAPDQSVRVFIITSTPTSVVDGNRADVSLTAVANTGSGAPGTSFPGAGQGGGNAVVGSTGADGVDNGFLAVQAASVALVKTATITDPFGGNRPVPGAIITYSIAANVTGSGSLANLVITDPIPVGTAYEVGTITLQAAALTDATDTDAGNYNGSRISVAAGTVPAGQSRTVTFKVKIP